MYMCVLSISVLKMFSPVFCGFLIFYFASFFFPSCLSCSPSACLSLLFFLSIALPLSLTPLSMNFLPNHRQAKVRELEEKCRSQSEQFNLLSKELEKFRLQAGKFDILSTEPLTLCESPGSPNKSLSQLLNGLAAPIGKGTCRILLMLRALKAKADIILLHYYVLYSRSKL